MPELISWISRSAGVASCSSTIRAICSPSPDDAAVAVGIVDDRGHDRGRAPPRRVVIDQVFKRIGRQQRHVARQQHECPDRALQARLGGQERVPGAELWLLNHKREAERVRQGGFQQLRPDDRRQPSSSGATSAEAAAST